MNDKMRKAINETFDELMAMPQEQFLAEFDKSSDGDIAKILEHAGLSYLFMKI